MLLRARSARGETNAALQVLIGPQAKSLSARTVSLSTALGRSEELASSPTLCRWENRADRETAGRMHQIIVEQFIASFKTAPKKLILDFDATDDVVHGKQEGRFFHGYCDHYCFLPLYVFCRKQLLVSYLRPSKIDGAKHAWAILALLVKRLRQVWPQVRMNHPDFTNGMDSSSPRRHRNVPSW